MRLIVFLFALLPAITNAYQLETVFVNTNYDFDSGSSINLKELYLGYYFDDVVQNDQPFTEQAFLQRVSSVIFTAGSLTAESSSGITGATGNTSGIQLRILKPDSSTYFEAKAVNLSANVSGSSDSSSSTILDIEPGYFVNVNTLVKLIIERDHYSSSSSFSNNSVTTMIVGAGFKNVTQQANIEVTFRKVVDDSSGSTDNVTDTKFLADIFLGSTMLVGASYYNYSSDFSKYHEVSIYGEINIMKNLLGGLMFTRQTNDDSTTDDTYVAYGGIRF